LDLASYTTGGYCDVCKMAVRYVDGILEQNATEAEIEAAVRKVCNFLPESVQTEVRCLGLILPLCELFLSVYLVLILKTPPVSTV
jgi:hypothetical protein